MLPLNYTMFKITYRKEFYLSSFMILFEKRLCFQPQLLLRRNCRGNEFCGKYNEYTCLSIYVSIIYI